METKLNYFHIQTLKGIHIVFANYLLEQNKIVTTTKSLGGIATRGMNQEIGSLYEKHFNSEYFLTNTHSVPRPYTVS